MTMEAINSIVMFISGVSAAIGTLAGSAIAWRKLKTDSRQARETTAIQAWEKLTESLNGRVETLTGRVEMLENKQRALEKELHLFQGKYWLAIDYIRALLGWGKELVLGHAEASEPVCPPSIAEDVAPTPEKE